MAFFEAKHAYLSAHYNEPSDIRSYSCSLVAVDIAKLFIARGEMPSIYAILGAKIGSTDNREILVPKPYAGRVKWGGHCICVLDQVVYDPILEKPLPLAEYPDAAFGQPIEMEDVTDILDRYKIAAPIE